MSEKDFCPLVKGRCRYDNCMFWSVVRVGCYVRDALACYVFIHEGREEVTEDITLYNVEAGDQGAQEFVQDRDGTDFFRNVVADIEEERAGKTPAEPEQQKTQRQIRREIREKQTETPQQESPTVVERLCKFLGI